MKDTGYIANNLNGKAAATFVTKTGNDWFTTDGQKVTGNKVYDTPEQAKAAAKKRWNCK